MSKNKAKAKFLQEIKDSNCPEKKKKKDRDVNLLKIFQNTRRWPRSPAVRTCHRVSEPGHCQQTEGQGWQGRGQQVQGLSAGRGHCKARGEGGQTDRLRECAFSVLVHVTRIAMASFLPKVNISQTHIAPASSSFIIQSCHLIF